MPWSALRPGFGVPGSAFALAHGVFAVPERPIGIGAVAASTEMRT